MRYDHHVRRPRVALAACAALLTLLPSLARAQAPGGPAPSLERVAAGDRVRTAVAVAQRGWPDGAATVLLASGHDPVDALAAGPLAAAEDAPILLTAPDHVAPEVLDELRRLDPQRVVLLGGPAAIGAAVEAAVRG